MWQNLNHHTEKTMANDIILYTDEKGKANAFVRFADEDVWEIQNQLTRISC